MRFSDTKQSSSKCKLLHFTIWSLSLQTSNESVFLKGLAYCKDYTARIRVVCKATTSSAWTEYKFKPGSNCFKFNGASSNSIGSKVSGVLVSPNPGSTTATVSFQLQRLQRSGNFESSPNVSIKILNAIGSEVLYIPLGNLDFGSHNQNIENLSALAPGLYLVSVQADGKVPVTTRWVKL